MTVLEIRRQGSAPEAKRRVPKKKGRERREGSQPGTEKEQGNEVLLDLANLAGRPEWRPFARLSAFRDF